MAIAADRLTNAEALTVQVRRVLDATREEVFDAFTVPEDIVQWWGPPGNVTEWAEVDLRPGGAFRIHMRVDDIAYEGSVAGKFLEISPPARLVMEMIEHCDGAPEIFDAKTMRPTIVTIELTDLGGGRTEIVLTHEGFDDGAAADAHEQGWGGALDKLAAFAAAS